jgi:hypothetical protein
MLPRFWDLEGTPDSINEALQAKQWPSYRMDSFGPRHRGFVGVPSSVVSVKYMVHSKRSVCSEGPGPII